MNELTRIEPDDRIQVVDVLALIVAGAILGLIASAALHAWVWT